jgi:hypothetical protein
MSKRIVLQDHKAKLAESGVEIDTGTDVFHIDPPQLWPDNVLQLAKDEDIVGMARTLLGGDDRYAEFVAQGGSAGLVASIVEDEFQAALPE